jgi:hypothetical protein
MDDTGGAGGGRGESEVTDGADDVVYTLEHIEFKKNGQPVRLRATSGMLRPSGCPCCRTNLFTTPPPE